MSLGEFLWIVVLVAALALEGIGLLNHRDRWPTLTDLVRRWVPVTIIAAALLWLSVHFGVIT